MGWGPGRTVDEELGIRVFDPPLPALRVPVAASDEATSDAGGSRGGGGNTSVLCFRSESAREEAAGHCRREVSSQCMRGARSSCVVEAVRQCKPSPMHQLRRQLRRLFPGGGTGGAEGWQGGAEERESRDACEDAFARRCTEEAAGKCERHGNEFCERVYNSCTIMPSAKQSGTPL